MSVLASRLIPSVGQAFDLLDLAIEALVEGVGDAVGPARTAIRPQIA